MQTCSLKEGPASKRFLRFWRHTALYSFPSLACILCCPRSLCLSLQIPSVLLTQHIYMYTQWWTVLIHTHSRTCERIRAYLGNFSLEKNFKKSSSSRLFAANFIEILKCAHKNIISRMNILRLIQLIKNTSAALALCAFKAMCTNTHVALFFYYAKCINMPGHFAQ